eukprot:TRINITY_DN42964_c0_g1_i1.p1 TRINITY_DN42964_c0_g1~~TRINITY_DN42964_c0_g1_i1.p1  ORF type:complete len:874 (+),score=143.89 TRINITY_DN42964_c0_g1_i1:97-2718(+)
MASEEDQLQAAMALSRESAGRRRGRFSKKMRAFGAGHLGGTVFEGNQIRLPAVIMSELFEDDPQGEHVYQVRTVQEQITFVGVKDYASPDPQMCVLPFTVMQQLGIQDGNGVELTLVNATNKMGPLKSLPVATELKLRWEDSDQYNNVWDLEDNELAEVQTTLENTLNNNFSVIKLNDLVRFSYNKEDFDMRVVGLRKRSAGSDALQEETAHVRRVLAESLGQNSDKMGEDELECDCSEVLRLRVPAWDAFDRRLIVEPPTDWIPPKPFPDAVWDNDRRMYYPAGWEWDETEQTYIKQPAPDLPALQRARSEKQSESHTYGAGQSLGSADDGGPREESRPLTQAELRQKRLRAMEERMARTERPPPEKVARHEHLGTASVPGEKKNIESRKPHPQASQGVQQNMADLQSRTFYLKGGQATRDISVELDSAALSDQLLRSFRSGGWACKWIFLYGTVHPEMLPTESELPKWTIRVQAMWEPPQRASDSAFYTNEQGLGTPPRLLEAPAALAAVNAAVEAAGLRQVGWLFTCPPREKGFSLRAEEVLQAAYFQLQQSKGYTDGEPPFVTLRMSFKTSAMGPQPEVAAWCATQDAMELRAKGFFETRPGATRYRDAVRIAEGFHVIQEGSETVDVDVACLHRSLPIREHSEARMALDLQAIAAQAVLPETETEIEYEQVTQWAPPDLRQGHAANADTSQVVSDEVLPSGSSATLQNVAMSTNNQVIDAARKSECERDLSEGLDRMLAAAPEKQRECCSTLLRLFDNVTAHPDALKFRTLKRANKALESKVFSVPGAEHLLAKSGWQLDVDADVYTLPPQAALALIDVACSKLKEHLALLNELLPRAIPELTSWTCSTCTLINSAALLVCDACGTPK